MLSLIITGCGQVLKQTDIPDKEGVFSDVPIQSAIVLSASPATLYKNDTTQLTCKLINVTSNVSYVWEKTGGTFNTNQNTSIIWTAPNQTGTYNITLKVYVANSLLGEASLFLTVNDNSRLVNVTNNITVTTSIYEHITVTDSISVTIPIYEYITLTNNVTVTTSIYDHITVTDSITVTVPIYEQIIITHNVTNNVTVTVNAYEKPMPARIVTNSVKRLNNALYAEWYPNYESDVIGYNIYNEGTGTKVNNSLITTTNSIIYGINNGQYYLYSVVAVNSAGLESEKDTWSYFGGHPRIDGSATLAEVDFNSSLSGFDFNTGSIVNSTNPAVDIVFNYEPGINMYQIRNNNPALGIDLTKALIIDMGYTYDFYQEQVFEWVDYYYNYQTASIGHTYLIQLPNNTYAKIRITALAGNYITFEWAYQSTAGVKILSKKIK